jgi:hypothetical protein
MKLKIGDELIWWDGEKGKIISFVGKTEVCFRWKNRVFIGDIKNISVKGDQHTILRASLIG